jgi:hypothetical protein
MKVILRWRKESFIYDVSFMDFQDREFLESRPFNHSRDVWYYIFSTRN